MLQTQGLKFSYDGKNQMDFPDINCQRGEQWLLLGQSGSGKTTLLHLLGGLRTPKEGKVIVGEQDMSRLSSCLLYTSPSPRDATLSRMPSSA